MFEWTKPFVQSTVGVVLLKTATVNVKEIWLTTPKSEILHNSSPMMYSSLNSFPSTQESKSYRSYASTPILAQQTKTLPVIKSSLIQGWLSGKTGGRGGSLYLLLCHHTWNIFCNIFRGEGKFYSNFPDVTWKVNPNCQAFFCFYIRWI